MVVVILMGKSLFAEGLVSRLQQKLEAAELQLIDTRQPDAFEQILAIQPSAVIVDETDPEVSNHFLTEKFMDKFSSLKVIRVNPQSTGVKIVHWNNFQVTEVSDLLDVLELPSSFSLDQSISEVS